MKQPEGGNKPRGLSKTSTVDWKPDRFSLLTKTPKEIFALEKGKFKAPPPMVTPAEKRDPNKYCEFHADTGHSTDECMQLRKQIDEMIKAGKLSQFIKELKQNDKPKAPKKGETAGKERPLAILMVQPWERVAKQKVTQSFSPETTISFPPLGDEDGTEGPMIIEAEIGGHFVHRIYVDGGAKQNLSVRLETVDIDGVQDTQEHRLNVREGCLPIRQKKRGQAPERNKAIQEEVEKLVDAGIMKEVHYHSWLSNPVMVKKHDGSWRMCVDFKDLNKACPQDGYPLPEIDWKVESLCGYPFKCFLDAYKGYHQIKMAKEDEEKMAFITNQGIFCYLKMPFGLKNAGATYQRLVDKAFQRQIGRNLEWGIDIAGPFPEGPGKVKFLIVAIDYFTKWIEAPVTTIIGNQVKKFVWDNIVCRLGLPGEIVSDNGKKFCENPSKTWCEKLRLYQASPPCNTHKPMVWWKGANRVLG
ncbi:reverse transcriptase domain-containing protein [Tanacetum coccineum]|uniref:Reverse transcriptase domain-containing protein n=1 Tax=Tanacetum coccineum TaxID=301880 RepID=A0ABQ5DBI9_9ASTR